jgi:FkbM family methyltransferase
MLQFIQGLKYKIARLIERNPHLNLFFYDKALYFSFLLPHEKDYYGIKLLLKSNKSNIFLDIGGNNGMSTRGFKKLGFSNPIYVYEPNKFLFKKYLINLSNKFNNVKIFNFGLGSKNTSLNIFTPFVGNTCLHYFSSLNKKYILDSVKLTSNEYLRYIKIKKSKIKVKKFDDLIIDGKIDFIKIDVEGFDHEVIKGMKKTISKHKPIFLVEYNNENIKEIYYHLRSYNSYFYNFKNNKLYKITLAELKKKAFYIGRSNKKNLLSSRNIFFLPKKLEHYSSAIK